MKNQEHMKKEQGADRKRKSDHDFQITRKFSDLDEEDDDLLTLSLSFRPTRSRGRSPVQQPSPPPMPLPPPTPLSIQTLVPQPQPQLPLQLSPSHPLYVLPFMPNSMTSTPSVIYRQEAGPLRPLRVRRNPTQAPCEGKSEIIPVPFPWATTHRATVHSLNYLLSKQIITITGEVQCKRCERRYEMEYNLRDKFLEVGSFMAENRSTMHDRAPSVWMNPILPMCKLCEKENVVKPIISEKKKTINWLFLLLGQMLGCCTLEQLKYFCKHTKNHRTGAKDRVLYLTYLELCKQLDPNGPFNR